MDWNFDRSPVTWATWLQKQSRCIGCPELSNGVLWLHVKCQLVFASVSLTITCVSFNSICLFWSSSCCLWRLILAALTYLDFPGSLKSDTQMNSQPYSSKILSQNLKKFHTKAKTNFGVIILLLAFFLKPYGLLVSHFPPLYTEKSWKITFYRWEERWKTQQLDSCHCSSLAVVNTNTSRCYMITRAGRINISFWLRMECSLHFSGSVSCTYLSQWRQLFYNILSFQPHFIKMTWCSEMLLPSGSV